MNREFQKDFLIPALSGLSEKDAQRVALALDAAIAFGALEAQQGNESLRDLDAVQRVYNLKCARLQMLSGGPGILS